MNYTQKLKRGTSCCFGGQLTEENLPLYKSAGIEAVEISFPNVRSPESKHCDLRRTLQELRNRALVHPSSLLQKA